MGYVSGPEIPSSRCVIIARVRWLLVLLLGCGGGAAPDAGACDPPENLCGGPRCGNGAIDGCYIRPDPEVCVYVPSNEACDGEFVTRTCAQLGYFGGEAQCADRCRLDEGTCHACIPGVPCATLADVALTQISVSDDRILVASSAGDSVILDHGLAERARVPLAIVAAAPLPGGWLAATADGKLARISDAGIIDAPISLPAAVPSRLVAGPGGVLVIWIDNAALFAAIVIDGALGTPVMLATAISSFDAVATTSGSRYFVVAGARLFSLSASGEVVRSASLTFFKPSMALTWNGTTGWYVTAAPHTIQRFDASGQLVGPPQLLGASRVYEAFLARGAHLVALRAGTPYLELVTFDPMAAELQSRALGLSEPGPKTLASLGNDVVIGWPKARLRVARIQVQ